MNRRTIFTLCSGSALLVSVGVVHPLFVTIFATVYLVYFGTSIFPIICVTLSFILFAAPTDAMYVYGVILLFLGLLYIRKQFTFVR